jgi:hypothetical protein
MVAQSTAVSSVSTEETAMAAATPDVSSQFLAQEEQGGGGGASQLVGGGWGGTERRAKRRPWRLSSATGRRTGKRVRVRAAREREGRGGSVASRGYSRGSSRPQGSKQEVEHGGHVQDTQVLPTRRRRKEFFFCRKPPRVWKIPGKK